MKPPIKIDNAIVLEWAWAGVKPFGLLSSSDNEITIEIFGFAICKYENSNIIYRFSCDKSWECKQDNDNESIEEAKQLPRNYNIKNIKWNIVKTI